MLIMEISQSLHIQELWKNTFLEARNQNQSALRATDPPEALWENFSLSFPASGSSRLSLACLCVTLISVSVFI